MVKFTEISIDEALGMMKTKEEMQNLFFAEVAWIGGEEAGYRIKSLNRVVDYVVDYTAIAEKIYFKREEL